MLKHKYDRLCVSCTKALKNKPVPTYESGLINFSNLIIAQFLVNRNVNLIIQGFKPWN